MAAVDEKVKQIIVEQLGVDEGEVTPSASFVDDLGADSLDTVELVMAFEEAFDIEIPDEDAEKIRTVNDAIDYIGKHAKGANSLARRVVITGIGLVCSLGNTTVKCGRPWWARAALAASPASTPPLLPARSPRRSATSILCSSSRKKK